MKRLARYGLLMTVFTLAVAGTVSAQEHSGDAAAQKAREETEAVFDLGRMFQFLKTMESEQPTLSLSATQARDLLVIMTDIRRATRIDGAMATRWTERIEDSILTVAQLTYVDRLYIARVSTSARGTGAGTGSGSSNSRAADETGTGSMSSFIAGGAFNPIVDTARTMGQDFQAYSESLMARR